MPLISGKSSLLVSQHCCHQLVQISSLLRTFWYCSVGTRVFLLYIMVALFSKNHFSASSLSSLLRVCLGSLPSLLWTTINRRFWTFLIVFILIPGSMHVAHALSQSDCSKLDVSHLSIPFAKANHKLLWTMPGGARARAAFGGDSYQGESLMEEQGAILMLNALLFRLLGSIKQPDSLSIIKRFSKTALWYSDCNAEMQQHFFFFCCYHLD